MSPDLNPQFWDFVYFHRNDNCLSLRLKYSKNVNFDVAFAIDQIEARQKVKDKLPFVALCDRYLFPSLLSAEQCTCEAVANYKAEILKNRYDSICDLTGGLGIDTMAFSSVINNVTYVERFENYCSVAKYNFKLLGKNVEVINSDCTQYLKSDICFDALYIDPARRGEANKRVFAFADCEPNVVDLLPRMFEVAKDVYVKASPMADISLYIKELEYVSEIYVISYKNECKEVLFKLCKDKTEDSDINIVCVDILPSYTSVFEFKYSEEANISDIKYSNALSYIYEPSSSILKAGAFKSVSKKYNAYKLAHSSHLYTSECLIGDFQGRKFEVLEVIPFSSKEIKSLFKKVPEANITVRNFPLKVDELRKKLKIKDGGNIYIFATTDNLKQKILVICKRVIA
jgi:16S rRNA G966 N2-methylase RsmD